MNKIGYVVGTTVAIVVFFVFFLPPFFPRLAIIDIYEGLLTSNTDVSYGLQGNEQVTYSEEKRLGGLVTVQDLKRGIGKEAKPGREVSIRYIGFRDVNGESVVFDETEAEQLFTFTLGTGEVIEGFDAGIEGMRVGGSRILRIAPEAGYGDRELPSIPANSTLFFIVELVDIQ